ncbi:MAG: tetratricopeptide repeat protein [Chthoniobacterales bacterium]|nr:tetratricopeptide repeat protein [Chthoniobacterales bacterium]
MRAVVPAVVWLAACPVTLAVGDLISQGDAYDRQFRTAEALEVYLRAEGERPDDAVLLRKISKQYVEMVIDAPAKPEKARLARKGYDYALRAKALAPDDAETRLTVAVAAGRLAFYKGPRERIELSRVIREESAAAMKIDPGYALAWHVQGRWHYEIASLNPLLKVVAETVYGKMPPATLASAVEHLERAAELDPGNALFHAELGRALLASGRRAEARRELEKSLTLPRRVRDDAAAQERAKQALGTF